MVRRIFSNFYKSAQKVIAKNLRVWYNTSACAYVRTKSAPASAPLSVSVNFLHADLGRGKRRAGRQTEEPDLPLRWPAPAVIGVLPLPHKDWAAVAEMLSILPSWYRTVHKGVVTPVTQAK